MPHMLKLYAGKILNEYCERVKSLTPRSDVGMSAVSEEWSELVQINDDFRKKTQMKQRTGRNEIANWVSEELAWQPIKLLWE